MDPKQWIQFQMDLKEYLSKNEILLECIHPHDVPK